MTNSRAVTLNATELAAAIAQQGLALQHFEISPEIESTNTTLVRNVFALHNGSSELRKNPWEAPALLATTNQTHGKGRSGRTWNTSPDTSLAFSIHQQIQVPEHLITWLPLIVGSAVAQTLAQYAGIEPLVKWPNDILVRTTETEITGWLNLRKLGGILVERVGADSFIIGVGINVTQTAEQLPVPTATSLALVTGKQLDGNYLLAALVSNIINHLKSWEHAQADVTRSGVRALAEKYSATLGAYVKVDLANGNAVNGTVTDFGPDGSLLIRQEDGAIFPIVVGDVSHLRLR